MALQNGTIERKNTKGSDMNTGFVIAIVATVVFPLRVMPRYADPSGLADLERSAAQ